MIISIAPLDAIKAEGNSGTTPFTFTISATGPSTGTNTVQWQVAAPDSNPADADGFDFAGDSFPSGLLTFSPRDTAQTITINVLGDLVPEPDEPYSVPPPRSSDVVITGIANATYLNHVAYKNSMVISIAPLDAIKAEGNSGT